LDVRRHGLFRLPKRPRRIVNPNPSRRSSGTGHLSSPPSGRPDPARPVSTGREAVLSLGRHSNRPSNVPSIFFPIVPGLPRRYNASSSLDTSGSFLTSRGIQRATPFRQASSLRLVLSIPSLLTWARTRTYFPLNSFGESTS